MKIAVIGGTGKEGSGLALRWANAGHDVVIGGRDAEKAQRVAEELNLLLGNGRLRGAANEAAAAGCELCVLSVPYAAHNSTLETIKPFLAGKVMIDVTVPINPADFMRANVPVGGSASKEAQMLLGADTRVVCAFQNISATHLKKLDAHVHCDVLICGDDDAAKATVLQLVKDVGMKGYDAGPLDNAVAVEQMTILLLNINKRHKVKGAGITITFE